MTRRSASDSQRLAARGELSRQHDVEPAFAGHCAPGGAHWRFLVIMVLSCVNLSIGMSFLNHSEQRQL